MKLDHVGRSLMFFSLSFLGRIGVVPAPRAAHDWTAALFACYAHSTVVEEWISDLW